MYFSTRATAKSGKTCGFYAYSCRESALGGMWRLWNDDESTWDEVIQVQIRLSMRDEPSTSKHPLFDEIAELFGVRWRITDPTTESYGGEEFNMVIEKQREDSDALAAWYWFILVIRLRGMEPKKMRDVFRNPFKNYRVLESTFDDEFWNALASRWSWELALQGIKPEQKNLYIENGYISALPRDVHDSLWKKYTKIERRFPALFD